MTKTKKLGIIIILCIVTGIMAIYTFTTASATENTCNTENNDILYEMGEIEKNYYSDDEFSDTSIAAKGNNIVIYKDELNYYTDKAAALNDNKNARNDELDYLINRELLYYAAKENGFLVSEQEVNDYLTEQQEAINQSSNKDDFEYYLKAAEMSEDEYWNNQAETIKKDLSISDYLNNEKSKIAKQNDLDFIDNSTYIIDTDENSNTYENYKKLEELWEDAYQTLLQNLRENENIIIYEEN